MPTRHTKDTGRVPTGIEFQVCLDIANRQRKGIAKYGMSVADNPAYRIAWLQHSYEEALDLAIYLKKNHQFGKDKTLMNMEHDTAYNDRQELIEDTQRLSAQQRFDRDVQREIQRLIREGEAAYAKEQRDEYDLSFTESFSQWLDAQGDAFTASDSFDEWLKTNGDSI